MSGISRSGLIMRHFIRRTAVVVASALVFFPTHNSVAQSAANTAQTDSRWYPWLGCWTPDASSNAAQTSSASTTCFVPVAGSRAVDRLTIVGGTVSTRDRLDAGGKAHAIDGQGCKGTETTSWSASGRRVFLQASYTCGSATPGSSTTIFAFVPNGEFLRIERVRSGGGSIVTVDHMRAAHAPTVMSSDATRGIERQQLAITTARAAAAAPISVDEIIDAVHNLDSDVVRSWIVESDQRFDLDGQQVASLARAGLPSQVVQAIMGASGGQVAMADSMRGADAGYWNTAPNASGYNSNQPMTTMYRCPPDGCYSPNQYSTYNGYGYGLSTNPYGYVPYYGYSPYAYAPYYYIPPIVVRHGVNRGVQLRPPVRPVGPMGPPRLQPSTHPIQSRPRGPVGRRP
jgi:hypothetical protein